MLCTFSKILLELNLDMLACMPSFEGKVNTLSPTTKQLSQNTLILIFPSKLYDVTDILGILPFKIYKLYLIAITFI